MTNTPGTPAPVARKPLREAPGLLIAALIAALLVALGTLLMLSRNLPQQSSEPLAFTAGDFQFAFGSGNKDEDLVQVNEFADGYALLSSGPIDVQADDFRVLSYTWLPPRIDQEAAFFWRRADDPGNVSRTDLVNPGTQLIDLSLVPGWSGKILEAGFLVAGDNGKPVTVGTAELIPDSLDMRLRLAWKGWTHFEDWSQQSINFLNGGDYRQIVALPLLVAAWFGLALLTTFLLRRMGVMQGTRQMLAIAAGLFLTAWLLLDIRWTANSLRQARASLDTRWHADEQQRLSNGLDGEIYQYVQRLKASVLGEKNARILIIGDEGAIDYYLFRAKYHLLPHSVHVARRFTRNVKPESLDYVIFFGEPANLVNIPGWKRSWQDSLVNIDSGEWGMVFRVNK